MDIGDSPAEDEHAAVVDDVVNCLLVVAAVGSWLVFEAPFFFASNGRIIHVELYCD